MKNVRNLSSRLLALLIALALCVGMLPTTVFAAEGEAGDAQENGQVAGETQDGADEQTWDNVEEETWNYTDEETGAQVEGSETTSSSTVTNPDGSVTETTKTDTEETVTTTDEDGNPIIVDTTTSSETNTSTTNPTVTNPDGSTTESGYEESKGEGSSTTVTTTVEGDPENPTEPVLPSDEDIEGADDGKDPEQSNPGNEFGEDEENPGSSDSFDPEDVSQDSDSWLGDDGITVDLKPGQDSEKEINATVADWQSTIQEKIDEAKPGNAEDYTAEDAEKDQIEIPENALGAWKTVDGSTTTVTIVIPTYAEDGKTLTGYKTQTIITTAGDKTHLDDEGSATYDPDSVTSTDPEREEDKKTTVYTFEKIPTPPEAGTETDENGNTVTTTVKQLFSEEYYIQNDDGSYTLAKEGDEGAVQVVVGYWSETIIYDADGNEIGNSSRSEWGVQNVTVTTPIRTGNSATWTVVTDHYTIPVTRATTTDNWTLEVDLERGGETCKVWASMGGITVGAGHGTVTNPDGLEVDLSKQPGVGTVGNTNTSTDLHQNVSSRPVVGLYQVASSSLNVRTGPGKDNSTTGSALENGKVVAVFEIRDGWGLIGEDNHGNQKWIRLDGGYTTQIPIPAGNKADAGKFLYLGQTALESALYVNGAGSSSSTWHPHQFIIYDDQGNPHYVYCADFEVNPAAGTNYGEVIIDGDTIGKWSDDEATNKNIAQHVQAIALNGYWGTASGTGSLESVKQMMIDAINSGKITGITTADVAKLTDGMALTATQAAIWSYATSGQLINVDDPFGQYNLNGSVSQGNADTYFTADEEAVAKALYNYLRGLDALASYTPDEINEHSIVSSSITVKNLAKDENGNPIVVKEAEEGDDNTAYKYNTDVSFVLETQPSQLNDDLLVTIKDSNGTTIGTWRLAGTAKAGETGSVVYDAETGSYTIENVVLAEGVKITLNLHGTQLADRSAYLITAQNPNGTENADLSQTFIGVKDQQRTVNLSVDLTFNVREPLAMLNGDTSTKNQSKTDEYYKEVEVEKNWDTIDYEVVVTATSKFEFSNGLSWENTTPPEPPVTPPPEIPETPEDPEDPPENPPENPPEVPEIPDENIPDENVPLSDTPFEDIPDEDVPLEEFPDEPVPLADFPATGDNSGIWNVLLLTSAAGLFVLVLTHKKKTETEG